MTNTKVSCENCEKPLDSMGVHAITCEQAPSKEQFAKVAKLDRSRIGAFVVEMEPREYIEINDHGLRITVKDARVLRDWLNKALPESAHEPCPSLRSPQGECPTGDYEQTGASSHGNSGGSPAPYSIEPHGNGYALYRDRDSMHHGYNLARITETDDGTLRLIERALNASAPPPRSDRFYGVPRDRPIWVCSVCNNWNHAQDTFCTSTHEGSHPTKAPEPTAEGALKELRQRLGMGEPDGQ